MRLDPPVRTRADWIEPFRPAQIAFQVTRKGSIELGRAVHLGSGVNALKLWYVVLIYCPFILMRLKPRSNEDRCVEMMGRVEVRTKATLREKVDQIIDEGTGKRRNVIVRLRSSHSEEQTELLDMISDVAKSRISLASSRDLMPPRAEELVRTSGGRSASAKGRVRSAHQQSMAAAVPTIHDAKDLANRQASRTQKLRRLASHDLVMKAASEVHQKEVMHFWASDALLLDMNKNDLKELCSSELADDIEDIHLNRTIKTPRLVEARSEPAIILDNKTSSWGIQTINALAAWGAYGVRGEGVTIGLLDTGVDFGHPDLKGKMAAWAEFDDQGRRVVGMDVLISSVRSASRRNSAIDSARRFP